MWGLCYSPATDLLHLGLDYREAASQQPTHGSVQVLNLQAVKLTSSSLPLLFEGSVRRPTWVAHSTAQLGLRTTSVLPCTSDLIVQSAHRTLWLSKRCA